MYQSEYQLLPLYSCSKIKIGNTPNKLITNPLHCTSVSNLCKRIVLRSIAGRLNLNSVMQGKGNRIFMEGSAHHIYLTALKGNLLFYRTEDYIFFLTLLYVLARRYGIGIEPLCIMFNHVHLFVRAVNVRVFKAFCRDLQSMFSIGYNRVQSERQAYDAFRLCAQKVS